MYLAVLDASSLWDLSALDLIIKDLPSNLLDENNLFLVLCECIANAAMHGNAAALGFYARQRDDILLLSFFQAPPMDKMVAAVLMMAREGGLPDYTCELPGGLGFPILLRLAHRVTINAEQHQAASLVPSQSRKKAGVPSPQPQRTIAGEKNEAVSKEAHVLFKCLAKTQSPSTPRGGEEAKTWRYISNALVFAGEGEPRH